MPRAAGGGARRAAAPARVSRRARPARARAGPYPLGLSHVDREGKAQMVDVSAKPDTVREARARATVLMRPATLATIRRGKIAKGDVLAVARLAGILAAKRTAELIPLCHPLRLTGIDVRFVLDRPRAALHVETAVRTVDKTGVEMEALTAAAGAALTIYDMAKALDRGMLVTDLGLVEKSGGKSGHWMRRRPSRPRP